MPFERLYAGIGYRFVDTGLVERALTHRSAGSINNERLEFLGDAILSFLVAETLFDRYPFASEGELTRSRAALVKGPTLARLARQLDLGPELRLGGGELKSGGRDRDSILADALEGLFGAAYLDGGMAACRAIFSSLYAQEVGAAAPAGLTKDPKTRLQEWLQGRRLQRPRYTVLSVSGEGADQVFEVECLLVDSGISTRGTGTSRRSAEQDAARSALAALTHE